VSKLNFQNASDILILTRDSGTVKPRIAALCGFQNGGLKLVPEPSFLTRMNTQTETLPSGDRLALSVALASLEMLRTAATELGCPIESLDERRLVDWVTGVKAPTSARAKVRKARA
jgi:hypothetical protein